MAFGFFIGNALNALGSWISFLSIVPRANYSKEVLKVLSASGLVDGKIKMNPRWVGEGDYAIVFAVDSQDELLVGGRFPLIVKCFKKRAGVDRESVQAHFDNLLSLNASVSGIKFDDWTVDVPRPLYVSTHPLAIVMTYASGYNLHHNHADFAWRPAAQWTAIADGYVCAMIKLWSNNKVHGDFALKNLMVDFAQKKLWLIDPGLTQRRNISELQDRNFAAARDLGHLLAGYAMDSSDIFTSTTSNNRRQIVITRLIEMSLKNVLPEAERNKLLRETYRIYERHVASKLDQRTQRPHLWLERPGLVLSWLKSMADIRASVLLLRLASSCFPLSQTGISTSAEQIDRKLKK